MKGNVPKTLPIIGFSANHPNSNFQFPKRNIFWRQRCCMHEWFVKYSWLHYVENEDKVYCFLCVKSLKENLFPNKSIAKSAEAFTYNGFNFWNKASERFKMHEDSKEHKV